MLKDCPIHPGRGHKWAGCFQNPKGDNYKPKGQGSPGRGAPPRKGGGGARQEDRKGPDKNIKKKIIIMSPPLGLTSLINLNRPTKLTTWTS